MAQQQQQVKRCLWDSIKNRRYRLTEVVGHSFHPRALHNAGVTFIDKGQGGWTSVFGPVNGGRSDHVITHHEDSGTTTIEFAVGGRTERALGGVSDDPTGEVCKSYNALDDLMPRLFAKGICYQVRLSGEDDSLMTLESSKYALHIKWDKECAAVQ